jgi:hypothetical protein
MTRSKVVGSYLGDYQDVHVYSDNGISGEKEWVSHRMMNMEYYVHTGEDTPNFNKRRSKGELLPYTYWYQEDTITTKLKGSYDLEIPGGNKTYTKRDDVIPVPTVPWACYLGDCFELLTKNGINHEMCAEYVQSAAANIYTRGWDALTFLAEFKHVVRMFKGLTRDLKKSTSDYNTPSLWLEGRYGWRTLLYDVEDFMKYVVGLEQMRSRHKQRAGVSGSFTETSILQHNGSTGLYLHSITDEVQYSLRGSVIADIEPPRFALNPVLTTWEVTKASFIVDWFYDVGQWLEAMSFALWASNYYASTGIKATLTRKTKLVDRLDPYATGYVGDAKAEVECVQNLTWRQPADHVVNRPYVKANLDAFKVIDLVALATQFFVKR